MQFLAKLHIYYISNILSKMNYAFLGLLGEDFFKKLNKSFNDITKFLKENLEEQEEKFDQIEDEKENLAQDNNKLQKENKLIIKKYFNINEKLQKALKVNIKVVIKQEGLSYDYS